MEAPESGERDHSAMVGNVRVDENTGKVYALPGKLCSCYVQLTKLGIVHKDRNY